jgi:hypothetical protein
MSTQAPEGTTHITMIPSGRAGKLDQYHASEEAAWARVAELREKGKEAHVYFAPSGEDGESFRIFPPG